MSIYHDWNETAYIGLQNSNWFAKKCRSNWFFFGHCMAWLIIEYDDFKCGGVTESYVFVV